MLIQRAPDLYEKLRHLGGMATDDVLDASPGPPTERGASRQDTPYRGGVTPYAGVYRAAMPNGKRISLLRVMFTDHCMLDCHYCPNSYWVPRRRYAFTVDELAGLFAEMHRRHMVDGLFLSSGIFGSPNKTTERLIHVVEAVRKKHGFQGYVHLKVMPGTTSEYVEAAHRLGTRLSVNMESPTEEHLNKVSGMKQFDEGILQPMKAIHALTQERYGGAVGQATQLVVGAADESDWDIYLRQRQLYSQWGFKRVYYAPFRPVQFTPLEEHPATPMLRAHRLYQMDWLSRIYGFSEEELRPAFDGAGFLSLEVDPKLAVAVHQRERFPVDVNAAPQEELLRVPGIGPLAAQRIVQQRRQHSITRWQELQAMGVLVKRALPFLRYPGHRPVQATQEQLPGLAPSASSGQALDPLAGSRSSADAHSLASPRRHTGVASGATFEEVHRAHIGSGCATCPLHQTACGGMATPAETAA